MTTFSTEADFERAVVRELTQRGWESAILKNPSEKDLIENWARILLENNRGIDRLNDIPSQRGKCSKSWSRSPNCVPHSS